MKLGAGPWLPDLPRIANQKGLTIAKNVVPVRGGYAPQKSLVAVTGFPVLSERPRGALTTVEPRGNPTTYAGTETKLYRLDQAGTVDATRATGGAYNCSDESRWEFSVFGDTVVAVNPRDATQYIDARIGTKFAALRGDADQAPDGSTGVAPRAHHIGLVGDHLVLGNIIDPLFGNVPDSVWWPQIRNPFNWPRPGDDDAVAAQSDRQPLEGNGGAVQRVIGGAEVGIIFQERAIWRMDYRGGDVIFELTRVEPNRGLLHPALAAAVGRVIFYCADDGWYAFDYTQSVPIGRERMDRFFFDDLDVANIDRVSMAPHPKEQRIYTLYPGVGNTAGTPNRYLCYDWGLNQFTHGDLTAELLVGLSYAQPLSLDAPHTTADPDTDGVDGAGLKSFDERQAPFGKGELGAFSSTFALSHFTGAALEAVFETGHLDLVPGWSLVTQIRPLVRGGVPKVQIAGLARADSPVVYGKPVPINEIGNCSVRSNGRYHKVRITIPSGGFDDYTGFEIDEIVRSGMR